MFWGLHELYRVNSFKGDYIREYHRGYSGGLENGSDGLVTFFFVLVSGCNRFS